MAATARIVIDTRCRSSTLKIPDAKSSPNCLATQLTERVDARTEDKRIADQNVYFGVFQFNQTKKSLLIQPRSISLCSMGELAFFVSIKAAFAEILSGVVSL